MLYTVIKFQPSTYNTEIWIIFSDFWSSSDRQTDRKWCIWAHCANGTGRLKKQVFVPWSIISDDSFCYDSRISISRIWTYACLVQSLILPCSSPCATTVNQNMFASLKSAEASRCRNMLISYNRKMKQLDIDVSPPACLMNLTLTPCYINQMH